MITDTKTRVTKTPCAKAGSTKTGGTSNPVLIAAAVRLADVLQTENAALAALNMAAATRLLPEKLAAANAFAVAQAGATPGAKGRQAVRHGVELEAVARRLQSLAAENRRLLERAMLVQGRVIATVAKAARATAERATPGYGAPHGAPKGARRAPRLAACAVATQA